MTSLLEAITIDFPSRTDPFSDQLLAMLAPMGRRDDEQLEFRCSNPSFIPKITFDFSAASADIVAHFILTDGDILTLKLINITHSNHRHPLPYQHRKLDEINARFKLSGISLVGIDHIGFNLPWFADQAHPHILQLRESLATACLYHRYPTGEQWDFILPGEAAEITHLKETDYSIARRPKFELVSFHQASTPLVQIDLWVDCSYEMLTPLFPEALADNEFRNLWLYTQNPFGVDICLVVNEYDNQDWSGFFSGYRI